FENGRLSYGLTDKSGSVIPLDRVQVLLHRPVSGLQDTVLVLERQPDGSYATDVALGDGAWIIEVEAEAGLEFPYRDVRRIHIREGVLRGAAALRWRRVLWLRPSALSCRQRSSVSPAVRWVAG